MTEVTDKVTDKVDRAIARFDRVTQQLDQRHGPAHPAARRERQRLNTGAGRTILQLVVAVGAIWLVTATIGLVQPIGMLGFLAALLATGVVVAALIARSGRAVFSPPGPSADLPNGQMVDRFDSYLYRTRGSLPAPAQAEIDRLNSSLVPLKVTLERLGMLDPEAQDARRLMSVHLPGLIDRYLHVPAAYRTEQDGEGKTVDERLIDGLAAGRAALNEISEKLARADVAALETQGRFIESRYGEERIDS